MKRVIMIGAIMLAGCATVVWERPGASQQDFQTEAGQCKAQALGAANGANTGGIYRYCMEGKGWRARKA